MTDLDKLIKLIAEIESRATKATPGPWEAFERDVLGSDGTVVVETPPAFLVDVPTLEFIAAARTDVPALCRALKVAVEAISAMPHPEWCESWNGCTCGKASVTRILAALKGEK